MPRTNGTAVEFSCTFFELEWDGASSLERWVRGYPPPAPPARPALAGCASASGSGSRRTVFGTTWVGGLFRCLVPHGWGAYFGTSRYPRGGNPRYTGTYGCGLSAPQSLSQSLTT
eukprot:761680-Rhodomonas_salina.1